MWNKDAAIEYLNEHAETLSGGCCAQYVREAIEAGGVQIRRQRLAKDYGVSLEAAGFDALESSMPNDGDIAIIEAIADHPSGHMAMYNGTMWISDFKQLHGLYPGQDYRRLKPPFKIYRYVGSP